ncbi:Riboflavin synthase alpha chain [Anaerobiospirillum thomasii]|uniref:Riboflavin synthase n=1 Tax=Anaerobiospirillum thomasii TaxID=179995 RepID=A0A2X0V582_9GAMM|nr:riboflavin synthase [Anaerobiospirillum thomasii]SPT69669.1 Riboflavin synthase alpha chain [Anaerobiospirillum thomasii]SPT71769.1 Riboflavin synthase alpha chain [Anaerobiospirillum thomasii]
MFTGIIECTGELAGIEHVPNGASIKVVVPESFAIGKRAALGDSVANNGVCLTITSLGDNFFTAFVSKETLDRTCFAYYRAGARLNLELACTPSTHLGGHIVQGHVDGVGRVISVDPLGDSLDIWIEAPSEIAMYIAHKGSIAIDGASLTVNEVDGCRFRLTIIPHTQEIVNIGAWKAGDKVNIEVDVLARYLHRLLECNAIKGSGSVSALSMDTLAKNGFL